MSIQENVKMFCKHCKDFSNDKIITVSDQKMLVHCLPKGQFKWNIILEKR